ncbi:MAG TPA: M23 family metallopeptidase [Gemmatimonadaceae bacterium]|nr:M23 family metallopeptidase [Gemmatimonadaceae bacterium]
MPRLIARTLAALALALAATATACRDAAVLEHWQPSTPHERYAERLRAAALDSTALGRDWLAAADSVLRHPVPAALPFREVGYFAADEARAVAYRMQLRAGQRVVAEISGDGAAPFRLFVDLYRVPGDSASADRALDELERVAGVDSVGRVQAVARRDGAYVLRVQPELLRSGRYTLTVRAEPSLAFPVQGRGSAAVRSFFGADRDGGRRAHHGIDIFAPRGTPAVAALDGVIRSTNPNRLGGNVVWLYDAEGRQSLYYAHLDTVLVSAGTPVRAGDTLGLVGNSGNARTTPPHLHFGIYQRGSGPVNPFPFVHQPTARPAPVDAALTALGGLVRVRGAAALLDAPDGAAGRRLVAGTPARVVGARAGFYRVVLPDGVPGYVLARNVESADAAIRRTRVPPGTVVRDRPAPTASVMDSLTADTALAVLGRFAPFTLVRTAGGREGWVALR